jgi:DNA-binding XRE family transcriptional regulator
LTQGFIAKKIGITRNSLNSALHGKTRMRKRNAIKLSELLALPINEISIERR